MTVQNVPIDLIDDNPAQKVIRPGYSNTKVEELAHSIAQIGLRQVPEARPVDDRYQLAYGHMRRRAFSKLLKQKTKSVIPETAAHIKAGTMPLDVREISDKQMVEYAIEENLRRADISPMSVARAINLYLENNKDETVTSAGTKFNLSQGAVSNMLRVLKCPAEILEKIDDGKINFTMARELLIFQGKTAPGESQGRWDRKASGYSKETKDDKWLMTEAVKKVGGQYGCAATVDGIKKAIFEVARSNFPAIEKGGSSCYTRDFDPLFDTKSAGCLKCEHSITCYETKTQTKHYCTMPGCWQERQETHKKLQAKEAKRLADAAVKKQVQEMEQARAAAAAPPEPISQEIPAQTIEPVEALEPEKELEVVEEDAAVETVVKLPAETPAPEKPVAPGNVKAAAKDQVGTRAIVLDLRELRAGSYGELKHGYTTLDSGYPKVLDIMEDPKECTERCTRGFHYAYDSGDADGRVRFVCSDPKCVTKKKSAFTRLKNAEGQAKKKAEMAAIKEAVDKTTEIDKPRMLLILEAEMLGRHVSSYHYRDDTKDILMKLLGVEKKEQHEQETDTVKRIREALFKKSSEELAKVIVEYMLHMFIYEGDIQSYKANTTGYLNLMGIGVNVDKKEVDAADAESFRDRAEQTA